jgi:hypothetical protein
VTGERADDLRGWFSAIDVAAARSAAPEMRSKAAIILEKQHRCDLPRPGGAARRATQWIKLPCGTDMTLEKEAMRDGGRIRCILARSDATLVGRSFRLLRHRLPETVLGGIVGRRLGDLVGLEGVMTAAADVIVEDHDERGGHQILMLDMEAVPLTLDDFGSGEGMKCEIHRA